MKVYATVSMNNAPNLAFATPVDYAGGTNPRWSTKMPYNVPYRAVSAPGNHNNVCITLFCERSVGGHKLVSSVNYSLRQLFRERVPNGYREYNVRLSRQHSGTLKFQYRFLHMLPVVSRSIYPNNKHVVDRHHSVLHHEICRPGWAPTLILQVYSVMR